MARSTFPSQNVQSTSESDHFWKLRCQKSARRCGAMWCEAHFEVKMYKAHHARTTFGSKKCTPLWREAHFEVNMSNTSGVRTTFGSSDVKKVHAVVARSTFRSQNVKKHQGFGPLLEVQMSLRFTTIHYTTLHSKTLQLQLHSTTLHYTKLNYTTLHYAPLRSTTLLGGWFWFTALASNL